MHDVSAVLATIEALAQPLRPRQVPLAEALGHRLGQEVVMDLDAPPFDRALLDGYAVRAVDAIAGAQLHIIGRHEAGGQAGQSISQGQCVGINTGAPMPGGADAVLMVEHSKPVAGYPDFVQVIKAPAAGGGVQKRGADARAGEPVLEAGRRITPEELAVAASAGAARVLVEDPKPRVAVLVTGDELVPIEARPGPSQIRNTNQVMLHGLIRTCGLPLLDLGTARDEEGPLRAALERGLAEADVLVVTGGMSMGTRDLVPRLLVELGVNLHVQKVRIKPGKPFVLGTRGDGGERRFVVGLPGNPVSAYVCFIRFVVPLLGRLYPALAGPGRTVEQAVCDSDLPANGEREFYQPCLLNRSQTPYVVTPLMWRGSADVFTLARAQGFILHPAGASARPAQSLVEVLHL